MNATVVAGDRTKQAEDGKQGVNFNETTAELTSENHQCEPNPTDVCVRSHFFSEIRRAASNNQYAIRRFEREISRLMKCARLE